MTPPPSPADLARPPGAWLPPPAPARSGPSGPGWPSSVAGASVVERLSDAAHASEARVERSRGVTSPAIARPASRTRPAGGVRQIRERSSGSDRTRVFSRLTHSLTHVPTWSLVDHPMARRVERFCSSVRLGLDSSISSQPPVHPDSFDSESGLTREGEKNPRASLSHKQQRISVLSLSIVRTCVHRRSSVESYANRSRFDSIGRPLSSL